MRWHGISDKGSVEYGISTRKAEKKICTVLQHECADFHVLFSIFNCKEQYQIFCSINCFIFLIPCSIQSINVMIIISRTYLFCKNIYIFIVQISIHSAQIVIVINQLLCILIFHESMP